MEHDHSPRALIERVTELIHRHLDSPTAPLVERFAQAFLRGADGDDLAGMDATDVYGALLSQWQFMRRRAPGRSRVRALNPRADEAGWSSPHTVIEIVGEDMPFLVDSVTMEVNRQGRVLHLILHPVLRVERDGEGIVRALHAPSEEAGALESVMHLEVDRINDDAVLAELVAGIERVLGDVRAAVRDWKAMCERMADIIAGLPAAPVDRGEEREVTAFLQWLLDGQFVFLGCRDYRLERQSDDHVLLVEPGSGLGLLRDEGEAARSHSFAALPPELRARAAEPTLLTLTKSNSRSSVHRPAYLDYIGVKTFDNEGMVTGERRVIGLFTSTAYNTRPQQIPLLRRKVSRIIDRAGLLPGSHAGKALLTLLDRYPRDDLFQIDEDLLFEHVCGMLRLGERQRTRLFLRCDPFGRFVSCLVFVPREHYNTEQRQRIQAVLMEAFDGAVSEFDVRFSESPLARIQIVVHTREGRIPTFDADALERRVVNAARRWEDGLRAALVEHAGEARGVTLHERFGHGFPAGYRERYRPALAVYDIEKMDALAASGDLGLSLYRPADAEEDRLGFKLYSLETPVSLSHALRMLERMGVMVSDEQPAEIERADGQRVWLHDFGLRFAGADGLDMPRVRSLFHDAFLRVWRGDAENDEFNRLVLLAGLSWREIVVLRAYARYLKQAQFTFSQSYMEQALATHPDITRELVALFRARFDPQLEDDRETACARHAGAIEQALEGVSSLDEDRILRQFLALMQATLRTSHYRCDANGEPRPWLSFKFDPARIPELPEPRPMFEIFVYSPRVEGVHLRGGKVARGGLRWSDRMEDFRTEVLGLVKAQIVKNALIVPVGSKGGFVVRQPPLQGGREAALDEGKNCYRMFLSGLLDLTDNLHHGEVVPPPDVVRHDDDDPYLVVAADKGTATFSDIANEVAAGYGFWLGDAFASGGSDGYDHKKMGITARGAWESVKRHFRELGVDVQREPVSVAGIGDMSGDVFGNGMLLSRAIRLVAAFDHRHIFIDPDPDPERAWQERERLFRLPRSSWDDYDKALISQGGGVWSRSAKSIPLSEEMRALLDVDARALSPAELIRAILRAPVDLLYNGGIGTYVKAAAESDAAVGDRANDAVRVDAADLRCRVVGEGGNLGFTQPARVEYALSGGRIFTDAIDNSGGVDCSDHEVNIKILLGEAVADGELTLRQRNQLLVDMTDAVADAVLANNYAQGRVLALMRERAPQLFDEHAEFMLRLARAGRLNRRLEALPLDEEIARRRHAGQGLVAPELAILLAHAKIELFDAILDSTLPEESHVEAVLRDYFPPRMRERFAGWFVNHPLRREIIATQVVNEVVNRCGVHMVPRLQGETGASPANVVRAALAARAVFGFEAVWDAVDALDNEVDAAVQSGLLVALGRSFERAVRSFIERGIPAGGLDDAIARFRPGLQALSEDLSEVLPQERREALAESADGWSARGVPEALARDVASLDALLPALDLTELAGEHAVGFAARVWFALSERLELHWLDARIGALAVDTRWQVLARSTLRGDLARQLRRLAGGLLAAGSGDAMPEPMVAEWASRNEAVLERYASLVADARAATAVDLPVCSVLVRQLAALGD